MKCWARNLMAWASLLLWGLLFIWFFICEMVNLQTYGCFSCCIFPFWTHGLSPVPKSRRDCCLAIWGSVLLRNQLFEALQPLSRYLVCVYCLWMNLWIREWVISIFLFSAITHDYLILPSPHSLIFFYILFCSLQVCLFATLACCFLYGIYFLLFFWLRWFLSLKTWLKTHVCPAHILCAHSSILFDFDSMNSEPLRCQQASMISPWMDVLWVFFLCVHLIFMLDHSVLKNRGIPLVLATSDVPKSLTWSMEWNPCCAKKFVWDKEETPCGDWLCGASASLWSSWLPGLKADLSVHFRLP